MSADDLFLGIDGGQSSTEAVIGRSDGIVLGRGIAGPCNHVSGPDAIRRFEDAILTATRAAFDGVNLPFEAAIFRSVCLGLSGGPDDKAEHVRRILKSRHFEITHDASIALWGALDGAPGVVVIAGTGSIAFARNQHGEEARAGGWGYLFGDEGGAWDIARRAVRAALATEERWGPYTTLLPRLLAQTGHASANQMLHAFYTPEYTRSRIARLAPAVDELAGEDEIAARILNDAGRDLAGYALAVRSTLFGVGSVAVSYVGGVFESARLRDAFTATLEHEGCTVHPPLRSPAQGALLRAIACQIDRR